MTSSTSQYTFLVAHGFFPLQEGLKRHDTVRVRRALERSQWWPTERIITHQTERLHALLGHAERWVPYYRDLFKRLGFHANDIRSLTDLKVLPFLTKHLIRANTATLMAETAKGLSRFNTGGSSGEPLIFFIGRERVSHDVAAKWRATRWWGVDIGDPETVVWGSPVELGAQDRIRYWRDRLMRTELLPAFEMSTANLDLFVRRIRQHRPRMLFGYPSALSRIAEHAQYRGIAMDHLGVRVAFVTAERLYDQQRETIQHVFGCPVANGYGSRDGGFIAHECPSGGMHLTAEDVLVEIVDEAGRVLPPGEAGEIVITHLATRDFPFVRYRTGDRGVLDDRCCPCGRGLPMLREIQGRTTDFVRAQDGTVMHGLALIYTLRDIPGIAAFKIVQESINETRVLVVPGGGFDVQAAEARIKRDFKARLGNAVQVHVQCVECIPPERSGKYRYVVSKVAA
jgi:phenylacetate-CoA ligase